MRMWKPPRNYLFFRLISRLDSTIDEIHHSEFNYPAQYISILNLVVFEFFCIKAFYKVLPSTTPIGIFIATNGNRPSRKGCSRLLIHYQSKVSKNKYLGNIDFKVGMEQLMIITLVVLFLLLSLGFSAMLLTVFDTKINQDLSFLDELPSQKQP